MVAADPTVKTPRDLHLPSIANFVAENDPDDEVLNLFTLFQEEWERSFSKDGVLDSNTDFNNYSSYGLQTFWMQGHNHISPVLALMSNEGEEWAESLLSWMEGLGAE